MTKLSVNVNKLATLRNARGKNTPNLVRTVLDIISYGAQGITVHPRPDCRHIHPDDVYNIAEVIKVEFNIEGYPDKKFLNLVTEIKPTQCTLVPDLPNVLTSNSGWNIESNLEFLKETILELHNHGIRTSLFVDPFNLSKKDIDLLKEINTDRVELYTEAYADAYKTKEQMQILQIYKNIANFIQELDIGINAGHDLNLENLQKFITFIPIVQEVSVGHALICEALYFGLEKTISCYLDCCMAQSG